MLAAMWRRIVRLRDPCCRTSGQMFRSLKRRSSCFIKRWIRSERGYCLRSRAILICQRAGLTRDCGRELDFTAFALSPIAGDAEGCIRAGAHEDINLITLLLGAEEAGLQILRPDGSWMDVSPPEGGLAVNVGDMLQRLTNHMLPSTTHRVVNPTGERSRFSRYSMPFFLHLRSDFPIATLPQCVRADSPNRYPEPILADDYLRERLIEIGLLKA